MPDVEAATAKLEASNKNDLAILRQDTVPGIGRTILSLRRSLQEIRGNTRISGLEMVTQTNAARAKARAALDTLETSANQAIANIRADIVSKTETKRDTQEQLVYELQKAAARRRIDQLNAQKVDAGEIIRRCATLGDTVALACLREDLPFNASDSREHQVRLESLMDQLDQAETPLLSGLQQASRILLDELKYGQMNLTGSFRLTRGEALGGSQTTTYPHGRDDDDHGVAARAGLHHRRDAARRRQYQPTDAGGGCEPRGLPGRSTDRRGRAGASGGSGSVRSGNAARQAVGGSQHASIPQKWLE